MLGLLDKTPQPDAPAGDAPPDSARAPEFEMVVGRRQVASWLFLMVMLLGVASTLAFLAGKMTSSASALPASSVSIVQKPQPIVSQQSKPSGTVQAAAPSASPSSTSASTASANTPSQDSTDATSAANPSAPAVASPLLQATILNAPFSATRKPSSGPEPPLFQQPKSGAVYLQMGAVDHGMAMILAEGLRRHGFDASVAPGPSEKIFRVLIGPLPDPQAFARAKAEVDAMELGTFARKYQQ